VDSVFFSLKFLTFFFKFKILDANCGLGTHSQKAVDGGKKKNGLGAHSQKAVDGGKKKNGLGAHSQKAVMVVFNRKHTSVVK